MNGVAAAAVSVAADVRAGGRGFVPFHPDSTPESLIRPLFQFPAAEFQKKDPSSHGDLDVRKKCRASRSTSSPARANENLTVAAGTPTDEILFEIKVAAVAGPEMNGLVSDGGGNGSGGGLWMS